MNTPPETAWQVPQSKQTAATVNSPATATIKPSKRLTGKQQAFIRHLIENPTQAAYKAAQAAGYSGTPHTLSQVANENMKKPEILAELAKYDNTAQITLIEVMQTAKEYSKLGNTAGASYAGNAITAANSLLDRLHGKATIKTELTSKAVTLNIDLTGALDSVDMTTIQG